MNESYKELLVKREKGVKEALSRAACVVLTVLPIFEYAAFAE